jgi:pimeloyl-ACP methyl ester carboxylesterase/predicted Ser/Thr protein kinase
VIPNTRYAKCGELNIAYQVIGTGPIDLVYAPGWVSNVEYAWQEPRLAEALHRLASFSRLILFDKRGTGLSDRVPDNSLPTLDDRLADVRAVMDAVGSTRAAVFGHSEAGNLAIAFAAKYPERTRALITFGAFVKRLRAPDYPWAPTLEQREQLFVDTEREWGGPVGLADLAPSVANDPNFSRWWATYLRLSASPKAGVALLRMNTFIDVRHLLPAVGAPALILQRVGDRDVSIEEGRYIAAHIPGAKLVELPGQDHLWWAGDSARSLDEVEELLTGERPDRAPVPSPAFAPTQNDSAPRTAASAPAAAPSQLLHYRILGKLGEGGMGAVYKALDTKLGRTVAIKLMIGRDCDEQARRRFRSEARAASLLNHPAIVTVHAIEEHDGNDCIVMEYVEGTPLDRLLARGPLEPARVATIGAEIADALDHAHTSGLVHRDVKPGNVIVTTADQAKVLDFGLAKMISGATASVPYAPLTAAGAIVGTLPYMSPEQLAGAELDGRADVFSLGCVLYEMATAVRAFEATDPVELVQHLVGRDPRPPSAHCPELPDSFDAIVMRAIAKSRAARFERASDLASALRALELA